MDEQSGESKEEKVMGEGICVLVSVDVKYQTSSPPAFITLQLIEQVGCCHWYAS